MMALLMLEPIMQRRLSKYYHVDDFTVGFLIALPAIPYALCIPIVPRLPQSIDKRLTTSISSVIVG